MDYLTQLLFQSFPFSLDNFASLETLTPGWYAMGGVMEITPPQVNLLTLFFTPNEVIVGDFWLTIEESQVPRYQQLQATQAYVMCLLDEFEYRTSFDPWVLSGEQIRFGLPGWHLKPIWIRTSVTERSLLFEATPILKPSLIDNTVR
jgi:hypothetical protein